jgi:hypothetical protein
MYKFWLVLTNLVYFAGCPCKLRPVDNFYLGMWPSDKFEFETPGLGQKLYHSVQFHYHIHMKLNYLIQYFDKSI